MDERGCTLLVARRPARLVLAAVMLVGCGARSQLDDRPSDDARENLRDASVRVDAARDSDGATDAPLVDGGARTCRSDGRGRPQRPEPAAYDLEPAYRVEPGVDVLDRIVIGDTTGDGRADVIAVTLRGARVIVFVQQHDGTLVAHPSHVLGVGNWPVFAVIDGDHDDHDDIVVGRPGGLEVLLGREGGELEHTGAVALEADWRAAVADIDDDGHEDVVTISADQEEIVVAHGTGDGSLDRLQVVSPPGEWEFVGVGVGDVNGDRSPDILAATDLFDGPLRSATYIHGINRGGGFPTDAWTVLDVPEAGGFAWFASGDFDADGYGDFVAMTAGRWYGMESGSPILFSAGARSGVREGRTLRTSRMLGAVAAFDLDMDGRSDVVSVGSIAGISVSRGTDMFATSYALPGASHFEWPWALAAGDVDCDGCPDVVTADASGLVVFRGRGCR